MNPTVQMIVRRAVAACSSNRITTPIQRDVRSQLSAPRVAKQVRSHGDMMSGGYCIMVGVFLGLLYHRFKPPAKTLDEIWMEISPSEEGSSENMD